MERADRVEFVKHNIDKNRYQSSHHDGSSESLERNFTMELMPVFIQLNYQGCMNKDNIYYTISLIIIQNIGSKPQSYFQTGHIMIIIIRSFIYSASNQ